MHHFKKLLFIASCMVSLTGIISGKQNADKHDALTKAIFEKLSRNNITLLIARTPNDDGDSSLVANLQNTDPLALNMCQIGRRSQNFFYKISNINDLLNCFTNLLINTETDLSILLNISNPDNPSEKLALLYDPIDSFDNKSKFRIIEHIHINPNNIYFANSITLERIFTKDWEYIDTHVTLSRSLTSVKSEYLSRINFEALNIKEIGDIINSYMSGGKEYSEEFQNQIDSITTELAKLENVPDEFNEMPKLSELN